MSKKEISLATVKEHNKPEDLWVIIEDKVYDVTKFQNEHPGGEDSLIEVAGRDGTREFLMAGHSSEAREIMVKYYLGDLAASDRKKKCPVSCKGIGLTIGAVVLGITLVYVLKRGLNKN
ncbi:uncharacterized protein Dwil_GK19965, isoform A [Drosophila willistoni]|uniref:Cytochrome b5 n=1 Tax=Drosophila willistoni TaxID=7260 RepID=B4MSF9_DROWI|nr:cytochrome b5 isoform X2 [Drosophila willistoni]EDW75048.1 uncharacterized protein Dwil_GK19965, isoform A [Drosophila willistoni]